MARRNHVVANLRPDGVRRDRAAAESRDKHGRVLRKRRQQRADERGKHADRARKGFLLAGRERRKRQRNIPSAAASEPPCRVLARYLRLMDMQSLSLVLGFGHALDFTAFTQIFQKLDRKIGAECHKIPSFLSSMRPFKKNMYFPEKMLAILRERC